VAVVEQPAVAVGIEGYYEGIPNFPNQRQHQNPRLAVFALQR